MYGIKGLKKLYFRESTYSYMHHRCYPTVAGDWIAHIRSSWRELDGYKDYPLFTPMPDELDYTLMAKSLKRLCKMIDEKITPNSIRFIRSLRGNKL